MRITNLDYLLPPELIATHPAEPRDHSRLLVYRRATDKLEHRRFYDLPGLLDPTDLLVLNDSKVLPAKLLLQKATGAIIPGLFLHEDPPPPAGRWRIMLRSRGKLAVGSELHAYVPAPGPTPTDRPITLRLLAHAAGKGQWLAEIMPPLPAAAVLEQIGHVPLPPYIEKARGPGHEEEPADRQKYQTVYARQSGSVAAPTAGLHFTPGVFDGLAARGIATAHVTLHVGLGTFLPVETATLEEHKMHTEEYSVPAGTIAALRAQRERGRRIVVTGTTTARTLEAAATQIRSRSDPASRPPSPAPSHSPTDLHGSTDLLIQPGYSFQLTDVLLTNFHLPRSTLLALVAAMTGLDKLKAIYQTAIAEGYRFYSYGDAMLILP